MTQFVDLLSKYSSYDDENDENDENDEIEYNDDMGLERLDMEYKLFTLNPLMIENEEALELLKNGKWIFNQSVIASIKTYLQVYLPKYIASYSHPLTGIKSGKICFGVDDDGLVYGIPFQGNIPKKIIEDEIKSLFKNNLRTKYNANPEILEKYMNLIEIEIIKINKPKFHATNDVYQNYIQKYNSMISKHQSYLNKKRIWENLIYSFTKKLHNMLNHEETRRNIIKYIKEKSGYLKKNFNTKYSSIYHLCDVRDYYDFIGEIRSDFQYKSMKYETIEEMKTNPTNIFYWVTRWKDSKTSIIKSIKPKCPRFTSNKNYPAFLLSQVHRMIPYWCATNQNVDLHLIKIKVSGCIDPNTILEYMEPNGNWSESYRRVESRGPESIPLQ